MPSSPTPAALGWRTAVGRCVESGLAPVVVAVDRDPALADRRDRRRSPRPPTRQRALPVRASAASIDSLGVVAGRARRPVRRRCSTPSTWLRWSMLLDDLHWADKATLDVTTLAVERLGTRQVARGRRPPTTRDRPRFAARRCARPADAGDRRDPRVDVAAVLRRRRPPDGAHHRHGSVAGGRRSRPAARRRQSAVRRRAGAARRRAWRSPTRAPCPRRSATSSAAASPNSPTSSTLELQTVATARRALRPAHGDGRQRARPRRVPRRPRRGDRHPHPRPGRRRVPVRPRPRSRRRAGAAHPAASGPAAPSCRRGVAGDVGSGPRSGGADRLPPAGGDRRSPTRCSPPGRRSAPPTSPAGGARSTPPTSSPTTPSRRSPASLERPRWRTSRSRRWRRSPPPPTAATSPDVRENRRRSRARPRRAHRQRRGTCPRPVPHLGRDRRDRRSAQDPQRAGAASWPSAPPTATRSSPPGTCWRRTRC